MTPITITRVEGERTRFHATSRSRPSMLHLIDLCYSEEANSPYKPHCSCEQWHIKGKWCAHLQAAVEYLLKEVEQLETLLRTAGCEGD